MARRSPATVQRLIAGLLLGSCLLAAAAVAGPAWAQSGLFLFVPGSNSTGPFTTDAGAAPTSAATISGGGSTTGFASTTRFYLHFDFVVAFARDPASNTKCNAYADSLSESPLMFF
jgi:hypothetical protein